MIRGARLSACGTYRFRLWRDELMGEPEDGQHAVFVMLNPSTADATKDDPTIRRCIAYAKSWGMTRLDVVNLFALRATDPDELLRAHHDGVDVIGPDNDLEMSMACHRAAIVVAAWGKRPPARKWDFVRERAGKVRRGLQGRRIELSYLALTNDGNPRHPLYLKASLEPQIWKAA